MITKDHVIKCAPPHNNLFWREDERGYTDELLHAGLYTKERAEKIEANGRGDKAINILEYADYIKDRLLCARRKYELIKRLKK